MELNNIVTDLVITTDGTSWHPVVNITRSLKTLDVSDKTLLKEQLSKFQHECEKSLAHRVLASKQASAFLTLVDIYDKLEAEDTATKTLMCKVMCSYLKGQPDCVFDRMMDVFVENSQSSDEELCLYNVRLIRHSSVMHEENRRAFIGTKYSYAHISSYIIVNYIRVA